MLTIGDKFPAFKLKAAVSLEKGKEFQRRHERRLHRQVEGRVLLAQGLHVRLPDRDRRVRQAATRDFQDRDAQVLGVSTDNEFVHLAWRNSHPDLKNLPFPMLADIKRELSSALGILHKKDGVALRATFIVDPDGIIRYVSVNDLAVGRNVDEVLRVLDALQTDELCPCNWQKGEPTLSAA